MQNKAPTVISALATFVLLLIIGLLFFFIQVLALNGVMNEGQAFQSLGMGILCQGVTLILAAAFAGWFSNLLFMKFDWSRTWSAIIAVLLGTLIGAAVSFLSLVISISAAGIR